MCSISILLMLINTIMYVVNSQPPPFINPCKTSDTDCLKASIQNAILKLSDGDEKLQIPPLKKIKLPDFSLEATSDLPNNFVKNLFAVDFPNNATVEVVQIDLDLCIINVHFTLYNIKYIYETNIKGKFRSSDIDVTETITRSSDSYDFPIYSKCALIKKDGLRFINLTDVQVIPTFKNLKMEYQNKENAKYVDAFDDVRLYSSVDKYWDVIIINIANKIFNQIPVNELFKLVT